MKTDLFAPARSLRRPTAAAAVILLITAFLLGGASRQHELRLLVVELASLPLLVLAVRELAGGAVFRTHRFALAVLCGVLILPLVQLIPVPPSIWTRLPGREELVLALSISDIPPDWSTLSMTPDKTWRSWLALIPPLAIFLSVLALSWPIRRTIFQIVVGLAIAGATLGVLQIASGTEQFYPWQTTSAGNLVGFFANRNHMATLILVSIPFAGFIAASALRRGGPNARRAAWASGFYIAFALVVLAIIRSRMGLLLACPSLALTAAGLWVSASRRSIHGSFVALSAIVIVGLGVVAVFAADPIIDRFSAGMDSEGRFENWPVVAGAAQTYMPIGSGVGSFDAVYRSVEPLERLDATFFNQAHNDFLETWLEAGALGMVLLVAFLVWFARRSFACWRSPPSRETDLQKAASIGILIVLLHSTVDYPLRTLTIAVLLAAMAAVLEAKPGVENPRQRMG